MTTALGAERAARGKLAGAGDPWDRRPGEPLQTYNKFVFYRDMGANRSVAAAHRSYADTKHARRMKRLGGGAEASMVKWRAWSHEWDWLPRAAAYDAHLAAVRQTAIDEACRAEVAKWSERDKVRRELLWELGFTLGQQANTMAHTPTVRKTVHAEDNKTVTVWEPCDARDILIAAKIGESASILMKAAVDDSFGHLKELAVATDTPDQLRAEIEKAREEQKEWRRKKAEEAASISRPQLTPPTSSTRSA